MSVTIHRWQELGRETLFETRVLVRCERCGQELSLREVDVPVLCPPEEEAAAMFSNPVRC